MVRVIPKADKYEKKQGQTELPLQLAVSRGCGAGALQLFAERVRRIEGYEEFRIREGEPEGLQFSVDTGMGTEAYVLEVGTDKICLTAGGEHGLSNGLVTLLWMCVDGKGRLECCRIEDSPRYVYRGFMLDVCRHFFTVDQVKRVIEQMALLKLTKFHWHLSDDQGYRIESRCFPELNRVGSFRRETYGDGIPHGGFYTWEEIREVVSYAGERFIEVIPEIDLPGHTTSITASCPQYSCSGLPAEVATTFGIFNRILCAGKEEVYTFLEQLLDEVCGLFPSVYFHIGGDEAPKEEWRHCPDCGRVMREQGYTDYEQLQAYFTGRLVEILKKHGKRVIGWNETVYSGQLDPACITQYWEEEPDKDFTYGEVEKGRKFICSNINHFYFDYPYAAVPLKATFAYEPNIKGRRLPEENVMGVEAPLWTESVVDEGRLEHMAFPRMAALAENAWAGKGSDFEAFRGRLDTYRKLQDCYGIRYASLEEALISGEAAAIAIAQNLAGWIPGIIQGIRKAHAHEGDGKEEAIREAVKIRLMDILHSRMDSNYGCQEIAMAEGLLLEKINDSLGGKEEQGADGI